MHPADIQAAIKKRGQSQKSIAALCGVTPSTVAHVVRGVGKSYKVASAISRLTGLGINKLWPGKYVSRGNSIS